MERGLKNTNNHMSSWETSGESYCNDRSKEFSKNRNILKSIQSILRRKIAYAIMLAGKKELKCL